MKTVQMTLDEELVEAVDIIVGQLGTNRSSFTREALKRELERHQIEQQEHCHREGYARHPVTDNEFSVWEQEQDWGDS